MKRLNFLDGALCTDRAWAAVVAAVSSKLRTHTAAADEKCYKKEHINGPIRLKPRTQETDGKREPGEEPDQRVKQTKRIPVSYHRLHIRACFEHYTRQTHISDLSLIHI